MSAREDAARALWEAGRQAWPELALPLDLFTEWLLERTPPELDPAGLVGADLYLVCACLQGVPGAADRFVSDPLSRAARRASGVANAEDLADVVQELALQMLTRGPDGSPPKLAQYSGRGALFVWLRMAVTRRALNAGRGTGRVVSFEQIEWDQAGPHNPELSALRRLTRVEVGEVFAAATAATPPEDRALLRLHYVEGSTLSELAALHRTSRSSMHRRIDAAREALFERVRAALSATGSVSETQCRSMLLMMQSDFRLQIGRLLQEE